MYLCRHIKVIPSSSYTLLYDNNTTLLLMENEMTKPGFALLRLVTDSSDRFIQGSTQALLNDYYISSKLWREGHTAAYNDASMVYTHGPCTSGEIGETEFDFAICLRNDIWPTNAQDCIRRLQQCGWPLLATTLEIVKDGVLFVPIGAKQSFFENTEWRMSFSLAEKRLIHAMNHTQFLCYGLLKLFLKEAIDANVTVKGLLCSYFLKTAVFWEISTTQNRWVPCTLLSRFWNCITRLLQWINCAYCPNFFVPQNNMFEGKIEGENREKLLQYLGVLYSEGFGCLLRCPSISQCMLVILNEPDVEVVESGLSESLIATNVLQECSVNTMPTERQHRGILSPELYRIAATTDNSLECFVATVWLYEAMAVVCTTEFDPVRNPYTDRTDRIIENKDDD